MAPSGHWPSRLLALALWSGTVLAVIAALDPHTMRRGGWVVVFLLLIPLTAVLGGLVWWRGDRWDAARVVGLLVVLDGLVLVSVLANRYRHDAWLNLFLLLPPALYGAAYLPRRLSQLHQAVVVAVVLAVVWCTGGDAVALATGPLIPLTGLVTAMQMVSYQQRSVHRAMAEVELLSGTDPLTGALNRRGLLRSLSAGVGWTAVLLFDLDRFKRVNDTFGHAVGDQVLVATARAIQAGTRPDVPVARTGGEEFVVVLHEADDLLWRAEQMRAQVAAALARWDVTVSVGATVIDADESLPPDLEAVTARADRALYAAKVAGRDRTVLETER